MATAPDAIRDDLLVITTEAQRELRTVAEAAPDDPAGLRAALFAATPLIVHDYADGAAALALDWFEEIRAESGITTPFRPRPIVTVTDDEIAAIVARTTESLYEIQRGIEREIEEAFAESMAALEAELQKEVAAGFRDTMTTNADEDPAATGWARFARPGGCKFCRLLADKGAVYTEASVHFAAHPNCNCVVGPSYDPDAPRASVMQYVASQRQRTERERKALRDYLNRKYPDAPG